MYVAKRCCLTTQQSTGWSVVKRLREDATNVIDVPARLEKVTSCQMITALLVYEGRILLSLCVDIASIQVVQHTPVHETCHVTTLMEQPAHLVLHLCPGTRQEGKCSYSSSSAAA